MARYRRKATRSKSAGRGRTTGRYSKRRAPARTRTKRRAASRGARKPQTIRLVISMPTGMAASPASVGQAAAKPLRARY